MKFILKGNICYSRTAQELICLKGAYVVCEDGVSRGVFTKNSEIPEKYSSFPLTDCGDNMIIPGLCDLHIHAPQYAFRGLGMDMPLLGWLNSYAFPEEAKYADLNYADKAYDIFVEDLKRGATTRASIFASLHSPATLLLMEKLEKSGLITLVGKVNMDQNSPDYLREESAMASYESTKSWIEQTLGRFANTAPIITPRFIPTCSSELLYKLKDLQQEYKLPVQSHISESLEEIVWVSELHPGIGTYGEVYDKHGLFGGAGTPTIMAHCIYSAEIEENLLKERGIFIAHCPQSNTNLSSGIAPVRRFLDKNLKIGLGSDVAGGFSSSIFRAISDAIQVSKLRYCLVDKNDAALSEKEAFYLATKGGGSFFGKVGSFEEGYEFDALVIDDARIAGDFSLEERLARIIYLSDDSFIKGKYVRGGKVF